MKHSAPNRAHAHSVSLLRVLLAAATLLALWAPGLVAAQESPLPTPASGPAAAGEAAAAPLTLADAFAGPSTGMKVVSQEVTPTAIRSTARFPALQDSYLASAFPDTNFGSFNQLFLGWNNANQQAMRMLLQFDLGAIPQNSTVTRAIYGIYQTNTNPPGDGNMSFMAQFMLQPWSEASVTWNNANYLGGASLPLGSVDSSPGWKTGNALDVARAWVSRQQPNNGLLITGDETPERNRFRQFSSREDSGFVPYLEVTWEVTCDRWAPTATVSPLPSFRPGSFTVEWSGFDSAPSGCVPTGIAHYDVEFSINGNSWVRWLNRTTSTRSTFNAASNGQYVRFRARATDRAGNVQSFGDAQAATSIDTLPPVATVNALPPVTTQPSFLVTWTGTDNLSGIATYELQLRQAGTQWITVLENSSATSYLATGAADGAKYEFRVRAIDTVGNVQSWSDGAQASTTISLLPVATVSAFTPPVLGPTVPEPVDFLVRWQGVTPPGTLISSYTLHYRLNGQGNWILWQSFPGTQTSALFPFRALGLGDGLYEFQATATNSFGTEPLRADPEARRTLDLAGAIELRAFMPLIFHDPLD